MTAARRLTGRHVALIFVSAFSVIISVNLLLAYSAVKSFPGLEVKNSYVASQEFDERRTAQEALGWTVRAQAEGALVRLSIRDKDERPVKVAELDTILGRATHVKDDRRPEFIFDGSDYVARETLSDGNWNIRMKAVSDSGVSFEQRVILRVTK